MGRAHQKSPAPRRLAVAAAVAAGLGLIAAGCSAGQITQTDQQVAAVNGASGGIGPIAVRDAQLLFPVEHAAYEQGDDAPVTVLISNNGTETDKLLAVTSDAAAPAALDGDTLLEAGSAILAEADQDDLGGHSSSTASASASSSPSGSSAASVTSTTVSSVAGSPTTGSPVTGSSAPGTTASGATTTTKADSNSISNNPPTTPTKTPAAIPPSEPGQVKIVLKGLKQQIRPGQTIRVRFLFEKAGELVLDVPIGASPEPRPEGESSGGH
ncbi:copper chaperone PCu(A)C [Saccharothrix syringae]|uniref:Copper chaperone PCu(A)C n=1 Tax=Saccharothrix syringae TaxID=103733 RepID=A0A5Q0GSA6_SACSY|nr:hypothetical protein [Saccharothrix syringae]QFZ16390.1 hypothetical protein EKG83_01955 [Saccharothrix syringae]